MDDKETLDQDTISWEVSAQDLENNPCLAEQGVKEGEIIGIPVEDTDLPAEESAALATSPEAE